MVKDAQGSKAPIQRVVDTVSGYFVPAVMILAILAFVAWYWSAQSHADLRDHRARHHADHRLPLRSGTCHTDFAHGRHRKGRRKRHPDPLRRRAAERREARRHHPRQDRDDHPRRASADRRGGAQARRGDGACVSPLRSSAAPSIRLAKPSSKAREARNVALADAKDFAAIPGHGVSGSVDGRAVLLGNAKLMRDRGIATRCADRQTGSGSPAKARRRCTSLSTARRRALSRSPTRSSPIQRRPSPR